MADRRDTFPSRPSRLPTRSATTSRSNCVSLQDAHLLILTWHRSRNNTHRSVPVQHAALSEGQQASISRRLSSTSPPRCLDPPLSCTFRRNTGETPRPRGNALRHRRPSRAAFTIAVSGSGLGVFTTTSAPSCQIRTEKLGERDVKAPVNQCCCLTTAPSMMRRLPETQKHRKQAGGQAF